MATTKKAPAKTTTKPKPKTTPEPVTVTDWSDTPAAVLVQHREPKSTP